MPSPTTQPADPRATRPDVDPDVDPDGPVPLTYESPPERRGRLRDLGPAGLMSLGALLLPPVGGVVLLSQLDRFAEPLRGSGWGPVLCTVGFMVLGGFALLPTAVLAVFAGWAFGFDVGFPVAVAGFVGAAVIGYPVARRFSGRSVVETVDADPRWRAVHRALLGGGSTRTFWIVTLLRVPTLPPFAATTVALAALHVRFWPFLLGTAAGVAPRTAAYVVLAARAERLDYSVAGGWQMLAVWGGVTLAVVALLTVIARRALTRLTA